ncbi:MAG: hypothetical protein IPO08_24020 [Xanthomonadales bacterium]|nr:hypothetical protein [Xanthomonadales bacterium]
MRFAIIACLLLSLSSCATITNMDGQQIDSLIENDACFVRVYQTYQAAIAEGPIAEKCIINGGTAGSFATSVQDVIERHKTKACACGSHYVYVQSRSGNYWTSPIEVTMIAFTRTQKSPLR